PDRRTLTIRASGIEAGKVVRLRLDGVAAEDGSPLLHDEAAYTINRLPQDAAATPVAKLVPPPHPRASNAEGLLYLLTRAPLVPGAPLGAGKAGGWRAGEVALDPADSAKLVAKEGDPEPDPDDPAAPKRFVVSNAGAASPSHLVSRYDFGDVDLHVEFLIPKG